MKKKLAILMFLAIGIFGEELSITAREKNKSSQLKGLVVHEWGVVVFSYNTSKAKASKDLTKDLPNFVCKPFSKLKERPYNEKLKRWTEKAPMIFDEDCIKHPTVDKPVIYFHSDKPLSVDIKIKFTNGRPLFWWPSCDISTKTSLEWKDIRIFKKGYKPDRAPKPRTNLPFLVRDKSVDRDNWFNITRDTDSSYIKSKEGTGYKSKWEIDKIGNRMYPKWKNWKIDKFEYINEKFLFYDGSTSYGVPLKISGSKERITLENLGDEPIYDVFVAGQCTYKYTPIIEKDKKVTLNLTSDEKIKKLPDIMLKEKLEGAGLFDKEAKAMAKIWNNEFFKKDGIKIIYRISQAQYDKLFPMTVSPEPDKILRVGLVLLKDIDIGLQSKIWKLIKELGHERYRVRELATRHLKKIGGPALPALKAATKNKDPEVKFRALYAIKGIGELNKCNTRYPILPRGVTIIGRKYWK